MADLRRNGGRERVSARKWRDEVRGGSNYLRLPPGVSFFSAKPGVYRLDFMSYVAGKGNPRAEPGEVYFERTFFIHQGIGPNQEWHICLSHTFKEPCPVCEYRMKLSADPSADEELIKSLAPKERQLWLVKDLVNDPDGVMVWDVSYHLFGRSLKEKIIHADEEDGYDYFADPVEGLTLRVAIQQSERGKWTEVGDIEFRSRKHQYPADIVEQMPCLDDMLVPLPYDKLKALLFQTSEGRVEGDSEDDAGELLLSGKRRSVRGEEEDADREEEEGRLERTRAGGPGKPRSLEAGKDGGGLGGAAEPADDQLGMDFDDVDAREERKPAKRSAQSKVKKAKDEDVWDDWD